MITNHSLPGKQQIHYERLIIIDKQSLESALEAFALCTLDESHIVKQYLKFIYHFSK